MNILVMRLGKKKEKERDSESKREVEGVCRILANTRNQPIKGKFYEKFDYILLNDFN